MKKRIVSEGMPVKENPSERGDLIVQFTVVFPPDYSISEEACARLRVLLPGIPRSSQIQVDSDRVVQVAVCSELNGRKETFANKEQSPFSERAQNARKEDSSFCVIH